MVEHRDSAVALTQVEEFVRALIVTAKAVVFYPPASSTQVDTAKPAVELLHCMLEEQPDLTLEVGRSGFLYFDGNAVPDRAAYAKFSEDLYNRHVNEVRFHAGAEPRDRAALPHRVPHLLVSGARAGHPRDVRPRHQPPSRAARALGLRCHARSSRHLRAGGVRRRRGRPLPAQRAPECADREPWDLETRICTATFQGHREAVTGVDVRPGQAAPAIGHFVPVEGEHHPFCGITRTDSGLLDRGNALLFPVPVHPPHSVSFRPQSRSSLPGLRVENFRQRTILSL